MTQSSSSGRISRRSLVRGAAYGAGVLALPGMVAACDSGGGKGGTSGGRQTITLGSNYSDPLPEKGLADAMAAYQAKSGNTVRINTVEHDSYQLNITRYLAGSPDDVVSWFAGYQMRSFAARGYAADISDLWSRFRGFNDALKAASTGADGKQYFVPWYYYPWALFYRKSTFRQKGYTPPATWDDLIRLVQQIRKDGGIPLGLCDKDGWPAMGTFDYINMRANGYQFHVDLMAGRESWTDPRVKNVFGLWSTLFPYYNQGANDLTWQELGQRYADKQVAMVVFGTPHVGQQIPADQASDIGAVPFPQIDPANARDSVEAPIDGFMLAKKARNTDGARDVLKFIATREAENAYLRSDSNNIAVNSGADTSGYNALQKVAVDLISGARHVSQFLDHDTRPDFAQTVALPGIQSFINNHSPSDVDALCASLEAQKKSIFSTPVS